MDVRGYGKGEAIFKILWQLGAQFWDPKVTGNKKGDRCAACLALGEAEAAFSSDDIVGA